MNYFSKNNVSTFFDKISTDLSFLIVLQYVLISVERHFSIHSIFLWSALIINIIIIIAASKRIFREMADRKNENHTKVSMLSFGIFLGLSFLGIGVVIFDFSYRYFKII